MKPSRYFGLLFASLFTAAVAFAGDPTGTWKWTAESPQGRSAESTLKLTLTNNQLSGTIENRLGKVDIRDAHFVDDHLSFTVVRKFRRREFKTSYDGKLEGDTITGKIETKGRDDQPVSLPWTAQRVK
jgi:hypothetical protein